MRLAILYALLASALGRALKRRHNYCVFAGSSIYRTIERYLVMGALSTFLAVRDTYNTFFMGHTAIVLMV